MMRSALLALLAVQAASAQFSFSANLPKATKETHSSLPDYFPKRECRRSDEARKLGECIRQNFEDVLPQIVHGGRLGVPNLAPYFVESIDISFKSESAKFRVIMKNISAAGLDGTKVTNASAVLKDNSMVVTVGVFFPKIDAPGSFELSNGNFGSLKFGGEGPFKLSFKDMNATLVIHGEKRPGEKYMTVTRVVPYYTVGGMRVFAKGLVRGRPYLTDAATNFINRFWREMVVVSRPYLLKPFAEHVSLLANAVFQSLPYDLIFPK
ncbi:hypothetical protein ONE63_010357 [Megalurothrips usitatus]|uniref:Circadian clock-controlled protein-like n=1 Tax=Megalurothrips usitatus TaxID=439358 RepID=A0AAV7XHK1_9NEOP|nr:hypothetical protein ONE63_010357 [Megalurothrips usitatus]